MLKSKESLVQYLGEQCDKIVLDNDICKGIYTYANEMYNIPKGMVSDLITKRMEMNEVSEFILFALFDSIYNVLKNDNEIEDVAQEVFVKVYKNKQKTLIRLN